MSEMTTIPEELRYTRDHEWARIEGATARVGITDFAQHQLGDIVFVELPKVGRVVAEHEAVVVIESVKSVSDAYAPLAGTVVAVNDGLDPATVNADPYGAGWLFELEIEKPEGLLTAKEYKSLINV
jgi:glycine cleavage system H protein